MSFKVGDRVRRVGLPFTNEAEGVTLKVGETYTVTKVLNNTLSVDSLTSNGDSTPFCRDFFELVDDSQEKEVSLTEILLRELAQRDCFGEVTSKFMLEIVELMTEEQKKFYRREKALAKLTNEDRVVLGIVG